MCVVVAVGWDDESVFTMLAGTNQSPFPFAEAHGFRVLVRKKVENLQDTRRHHLIKISECFSQGRS